MPSPVYRRKINSAPQEVPKNGLICWHRLWGANLFLQSEDFTSSSWVKTKTGAGTDPVVTAGQTDPNGGSTAFRVQMDAGGTSSGDVSGLQQAIPGLTVATTVGLWLKSNTESSQAIRILASNVGTNITITTSWQFYQITPGSYSASNCGFRAKGDVQRVLDILVWHPQVYPGITLPSYFPTTTLQTWADLSGHGYTLQRGATSGAEASDPTVLGPGISFVNDDYMVTGNLAEATMAGPWTVLLAVLPNGSANKKMWALGISSGDTQRQCFYQGSATQLVIASKNSTSNTSSALTKSQSAIQVFAMTCGGADNPLVLRRLDTGETVTAVNKNPTGTSRIVIGANSQATEVIDSMTVYEHLFYNRVLTTGEIRRVANKICDYWAQWGVAVAKPL
jgi:hypothetical protein